MLLIGAGLLLASFQRVLARAARLRRAPRHDRHRQPAGLTLQGGRELIAFWNRLDGQRARAARRPGGRHRPAASRSSGDTNDSVILAEGYVDGAGRVADLAVQLLGLARLLRGDVDSR